MAHPAYFDLNATTDVGVPVENTIHRHDLPTNPADLNEFIKTGCDTLRTAPPTPDFKANPATTHQRELRHSDIKLKQYDNVLTSVWTWQDSTKPDSALQWPGPTLRFKSAEGGAVNHSWVKSRHGQHSIHHHGLEPEPINDGVGHVTMEAGQDYMYQFTCHPEAAGTYFYHCHRNTPLHFEMGMYGMLIVDPPEGPGTAYHTGPKYDVEFQWVPDDIDPVWRTIAGGAPDGTPANKFNMDCSPGQDWEGFVSPQFSGNLGDATQYPSMSENHPMYFVVSGHQFVPIAGNPKNLMPSPAPIHVIGGTEVNIGNRATAVCNGGQTGLIRLLTGGFTYWKYTFGLDMEVIAMDGRALGQGSAPGVLRWSKYNYPFRIPAGTPFFHTVARRWDLLFRPKRAGVYPVKMEAFDSYTHQHKATLNTNIVVPNSRFFIPAIQMETIIPPA